METSNYGNACGALAWGLAYVKACWIYSFMYLFLCRMKAMWCRLYVELIKHFSLYSERGLQNGFIVYKLTFICWLLLSYLCSWDLNPRARIKKKSLTTKIFPSYFSTCKRSKKVNFKNSHSVTVMSNSLWPHELHPSRLLCPWDSPGRVLEWVAISLSRGSSWPRDRTHVSFVSCIAGRFFTAEPSGKPQWLKKEAC